MSVIFESGLNAAPVNWVELTDADITSATFQNTGYAPFFLQATAGAKPTSLLGSIEYPGAAKETNVDVAALFPGVASADRLWAYSAKETTVMISHEPSTNKTVTLTPSEDFTHARIAHSINWLSGGTATASSTASAFFADAPLNSLTYERWEPNALAATWEYDHGSTAECDYCCIAAHTMGTNGNSLQVQYWDGSAWADLSSVEAIPDDSPIMVIFEAQTRQRWRVSITGGTAPEIGVIKFGKALQMQRAIYGGHAPIDLARQTVLRSNFSETGEFLGRSKQRGYLATSFAWRNLTAGWIRTNWPDMQRAVESEPFFIAWRPATYGAVGYCQTDEVPIPSNSGQSDFMSVRLSVRGRGYD